VRSRQSAGGGTAIKTVSREQVARAERAGELALPARVQEALGQLVGSAREGLLALSVGVGLGVLAGLLEEEVVDADGAKGKHDPDRVAVQHGHESGEVTLGGRRIAVERPRVRSADGRAEVRLQTYEYFTDRDPLTKAVLERMLAGDPLRSLAPAAKGCMASSGVYGVKRPLARLHG
jgi:putative transposase